MSPLAGLEYILGHGTQLSSGLQPAVCFIPFPAQDMGFGTGGKLQVPTWEGSADHRPSALWNWLPSLEYCSNKGAVPQRTRNQLSNMGSPSAITGFACKASSTRELPTNII